MSRRYRLALAGLAAVLLGSAVLVARPAFEPTHCDLRVGVVHRDISAISTAMEAFEGQCGRYPSTAEGLSALVAAPSGVIQWQGPYIETPVTLDPWGKSYQYTSPGAHNVRGFDLASAGVDGKFGTPDDFDNWSAFDGNPGQAAMPKAVWLVLSAPLAIVAIMLLVRIAWSAAPAIAGPTGLCLICGYDLRATPRRCPECGTVAKSGG